MRFPRTKAQPGPTRAAAPDTLAATISQGFPRFGTFRYRNRATYERRIACAFGERRRSGRGSEALPMVAAEAGEHLPRLGTTRSSRVGSNPLLVSL